MRFLSDSSFRLSLLAASVLTLFLILPLFIYLLLAGAPQEGSIYASAGISAFLCGGIAWYLCSGEISYLRGALAGALTGALFQIPAWLLFMLMNFFVGHPPLTVRLDPGAIGEGALLLALPVFERTMVGYLIFGGVVGVLLARMLGEKSFLRSGGD